MLEIDIRAVAQPQRRAYWALLLDADPDAGMVSRYLDEGEMYAVFAEGEAVCEAVVVPRPGGGCELKNLATAPDKRGQGYASLLLQYLFLSLAARFGEMFVGTSEKGVGFYERQGFAYSHTVPGFFTDHYPEPVYEDGVRCQDMHYLRRTLP